MTLFTDSIFLTDELDAFLSCCEKRSATSMTLFLCEAGYLDTRIDDRPLRIGANDLYVRVPSPDFRPGPFNFSPDCRFVLLTIDASIYEQLMLDHMRIEPRWWQKQQYLKANPVSHLNQASLDFCHAYLNLLALQLRDKQSDYRRQILGNIARAASMEMLNYLDKVLQPSSADTRVSVDRSDYTFRLFTQLLHDNPNQREVQWFAQQLDITPKYLSEICRARSGRSASEWIADITVSNIKHHLRHSALPIREIAESLNFPNASFFCQYTKKHTGLTPNQLRRQKVE